MARPDPTDVLARLFLVVYRSLPMYLVDAIPWTHPSNERAQQALSGIVADERLYAQRIADLILRHRGRIETGDFPMEFTDLNLLSLDFLLTEMVRCQRRDIGLIERCVADLAGDAEARALAQEILGNARGHLETLQELLKRPDGEGLRIAAAT